MLALTGWLKVLTDGAPLWQAVQRKIGMVLGSNGSKELWDLLKGDLPLVRIDFPSGRATEDRRIIADVICDAMIATLKVPQNDRFQIISERERDDLIIDPTYLSALAGRNHHPDHPQRRPFRRVEAGVLKGGRGRPAR